MDKDYYVYGYYDPRNMQCFYIGKGKDLRRFAHLTDDGSSKKVELIKSIQEDGEEPIIRVIVNGCSEAEALLIESTLIWWNQSSLTNKVAGHGISMFRPNLEYSLLKKVPGFDFSNGIFLVNCGDGETRSWEDHKRFNFISAGHDPKWSRPLKRLNIGDIVVAYLKGDGYMAVGKVISTAVKAKDFISSDGTLINEVTDLSSPNLFHNKNDEDFAEFCVGVDWIKAFNRGDGKFKTKSGLYTTPLIVTSLFNQPKTIEYIEEEFDIAIEELL